MVKSVNESNFAAEVLNAAGGVVVDMYADWCGPCKMMAPVLEEFTRDHETFRVGKVDVDRYPELAQEFHVMSVPTFLLFCDGRVKARVSGMMKKKDLEDWAEQMRRKQ